MIEPTLNKATMWKFAALLVGIIAIFVYLKKSESRLIDNHLYSLKDGKEYGYEMAVSEHDQQAGLKAKSLVMFKYSGSKDGLYQVYSRDDAAQVLIVIECAKPCEFLKLMTYVNGQDVPKIERMRAIEGTIGHSVMSDALAGNLEQIFKIKDGVKHRVWLTDHGTLMEMPV